MPSTKPAQILDALFARAALMETQGPTLPVSFPEPAQPFVPPADGKYLRVDGFPNGYAWQGLSSGKMDMGLLQITVVWPRSEGEIKPTDVAGLVQQHFAKGSAYYSGSTKVTITAEPRIAPPLTDADRVNVPVIVAWMA